MTPLFVEASGICEPVFACILQPYASCRLAAAWCLRAVIRAVPTLATPLIDRCINRLDYLHKSATTVSGAAFALAALTNASLQTELGTPFAKSRKVFWSFAGDGERR